MARAMGKICLELTTKNQNDVKRDRSGIFTVNFEYNSYIYLVFLLVTLNK